MCGFRIEVDGIEVGDKSWNDDSISPERETIVLRITYPPHGVKQARVSEYRPDYLLFSVKHCTNKDDYFTAST